MNKTLLTSLIALLIAADHVSAEPVSDTPEETLSAQIPSTADNSAFTTNSTIDDFLNYAFEHNRAIMAAEAGAASKAERTGQVGFLEDPDLTFEYMLEQRDMQYKIGLTQAIPGFGKLRLKKRMARDEAQASAHDTEAMRLMVFEKVITAFYNYHYLGRSIEVADDNIVLLADLEKVLLSKYKTQGAKYSDVLKVQVEKDSLLNKIASLKDMRSILSADLAATLDLPTDRLLPWPKAVPSASTALSNDILIDMIADLNPELKSLDSRVQSLSAAVTLAEKERLPNFMIGAAYTLMPEMDNGSTPSDVGLMVGISLPIWWGKYKSAGREAALSRESVRNMRKQLENSLQVDLMRALFDLHDADRQIALLKSSLIPKAKQAFEVARQEFMSGETQFLNLIDAQRKLFELSLNFERASADREIALAQIGCCVGKYDMTALGIGKAPDKATNKEK